MDYFPLWWLHRVCVTRLGDPPGASHQAGPPEVGGLQRFPLLCLHVWAVWCLEDRCPNTQVSVWCMVSSLLSSGHSVGFFSWPLVLPRNGAIPLLALFLVDCLDVIIELFNRLTAQCAQWTVALHHEWNMMTRQCMLGVTLLVWYPFKSEFTDRNSLSQSDVCWKIFSPDLSDEWQMVL